MTRKFQALIIGLGPAGMAAAVELAQKGVQVAVVDENPEPGGQIYRQPPDEFTIEDQGFLGVRYRVGQNIIRQFNQLKDKITIFSNTMAWGFFEGTTMALEHEGHIELVEFDKLILCEGAMERSIPFPGWTLPGIMTAGGLQKMIKHQRMLPGKRFLLSGASPLQLSVAASLVKDGAEVAALCEATSIRESLKLLPKIIRQKGLFKEAVSYLFPVLKKSVPILRPYSVISAKGDNKVREATVARLDENWAPISGTEKTFEVDVISLGYGFLPVARLARLCGCAQVYDPVLKSWKPKTDVFMQTSVENIYTAGDSSGVEGADLAEVEGRIAGVHAAAELAKISMDERDQRLKSHFRTRDRIKGYSNVLNQVFSPRSGLYTFMEDDTIVCRCEQITASEVFAGIEKGYRNINEIKRIRVCMGPCQGRTCESIVTQLMLNKGITIEEIGHMTIRPPIAPMPVFMFEEYARTLG
ncbi:MAG: FAD-dependent oxidoreductase [Desulfarculaceae bacterium]|jgi:thioredoxin reductase